MNINYEVAMMDTASENGLEDVVKTLHYRITLSDVDASEDTVIPFKFGTVELDAPTAENFTNYGDLDKETVTTWLKSQLDCDRLEAELQYELDANRTISSAPKAQTTSKLPTW